MELEGINGEEKTMIVKSKKHVDLSDGTYWGLWTEWEIIIPFTDDNMRIPVSHGNPAMPGYLFVAVLKNELSFEVK